MKRVTAFLSAVMLLIVMLPASAIIASAATDGDWEYKVLDDGTAEITKYTGAASAVTIPSKIGRYTVTAIGGFSSNNTLVNITLSDGVKVIKRWAFAWCDNLVNVTLNEGLTDIEGDAFYACNNLKSVDIPGTVKTIGSNAFYSCDALASVIIGNGVTSIGVCAFTDCKKLKSVVIPDSTIVIGSTAFYGCDNLENVVLGNSVTTVGNNTFGYCQKLKSINIPNSVTSIGYTAFYECRSLETVVLGTGLTKIDNTAFYNCSSLKNIIVPDKIRTLRYEMFMGCGHLESVVLGKNITVIEMRAFKGCEALQSITIPSTVTSIEADAFADCVNLTDVYFHGSEAQWNVIAIKSGNGALNVATIHCERYPDVKNGSWYYDAVEYVSDKGCMSGYKNGNFGPANNLQRQDFVVMLARIAKANLDRYLNSNGGMIDVSKTAYFAGAVAWAVDNGIITGYKNGKFGVSDKITREQVATILYRYCGEPTVKNADATLSQFPDKNRISPYAKNAMAWAVQNGVISGTSKGTISPATGASRAQIATIIMRMYLKGLL